MNGQFEIGDIVLKQWTIKRLIGEGSHGRVFEIEREGYGHIYKSALKIITIPQNQSEIKSVIADGLSAESVTSYFRSFVEELVEEFSLMTKLKGNSNIVSYEDHDVIQHEGRIGWDILIRMELLTPLLDYAEGRSLTQNDVMQLGIDICKALQLCQRFNIIHRDVKPENIFFSDTGDFKLGDFKIARTEEKTTNGLLRKGTYMAPEMYSGEPYDSSVDLYSLGIVLYRFLNENRIPFLPEYPAEFTHLDKETALTKRMNGLPMAAPINADRRLAEIVLKACAHDPKARFSSPAQMREALETVLYGNKEQSAAYLQGPDVSVPPGERMNTGPLPPPAREPVKQEPPPYSFIAPPINGEAVSPYRGAAGNDPKLPFAAPNITETKHPYPGIDAGDVNPPHHRADAGDINPPYRRADVGDVNPLYHNADVGNVQPAYHMADTGIVNPAYRVADSGDVNQPYRRVNSGDVNPTYSRTDAGDAQPAYHRSGANEPTAMRSSSYIPLTELSDANKKKIQPIIKIGASVAAVLILVLVLLFVFTKPDDSVNVDGSLRSRLPSTDVSDASPAQSEITLHADNPDSLFSADNLFSLDDKENVDDEYDEDGNLIKRILKSTVGEITGWLEFTYHDNGNIKEKVECDADGNTLKRGFFDENGSLSYFWINRYDASGRRVLSVKYNENSIQTISHEFIYDATGVNTGKIDRWYDENGVLYYYIVNELFDSGRTGSASIYRLEDAGEMLSETQEYSADGKLVFDTYFEYNESGSLENRIVYEYDVDSELLSFIHEYNESDVKVLLTEFDYDGNGAETERRENDLNASGAVVRTRFYHPGAATPYRTFPELTATYSPTQSTDNTSSTSPSAPPLPPCGGRPDHGVYYDQVPVLSFNEQGYKTRETFFYLCGCVSHYFEYTYNDDGKVTSITKYDVW